MDGMRGRVCLITGATSGIGKETARSLAALGASLVLPARDTRKGEATKKGLVESTGNSEIEMLECDLSSFESIAGFCDRFREKHEKLHVLINDAGVWEKRRGVSKDGIELTFATNFLAPFLMTNLLLPTIKRSAPARVINVTSDLHGGEVDFKDIEGKERFRPMNAYRQSKLEDILFTRELSRRLEGSGVTANCLMPGFVRTGLFRNASPFTRGFVKLITSSPAKGARTSVYLASSPEVENISGECFKKCRKYEASAYSSDMEAARRLWDVGIGYVGKWL